MEKTWNDYQWVSHESELPVSTLWAILLNKSHFWEIQQIIEQLINITSILEGWVFQKHPEACTVISQKLIIHRWISNIAVPHHSKFPCSITSHHLRQAQLHSLHFCCSVRLSYYLQITQDCGQTHPHSSDLLWGLIHFSLPTMVFVFLASSSRSADESLPPKHFYFVLHELSWLSPKVTFV